MAFSACLCSCDRIDATDEGATREEENDVNADPALDRVQSVKGSSEPLSK